jgi:hypothetical protein
VPTAIPIPEHEAIPPVNCSMKNFCADLLRNISKQELQTLISKLVTEQVKTPQGPSNEVTNRTSLSYLQNSFTAGVLFVLVLAMIAMLQVLESIVRFPHILPRTAMYVTLGVICASLLLIPTGMLWVLHSKICLIVACCSAFLLMIFGAIQKKLIPNFF